MRTEIRIHHMPNMTSNSTNYFAALDAHTVNVDTSRETSQVQTRCYGSTGLGMYDEGFYDRENVISITRIASSEAEEKAVIFGSSHRRLLIEDNPGAVSIRWRSLREPLAILLASRTSGRLQHMQTHIWGFSTYKRGDRFWRCEAWLHPCEAHSAQYVRDAIMQDFGLSRPSRIRDNNARYRHNE